MALVDLRSPLFLSCVGLAVVWIGCGPRLLVPPPDDAAERYAEAYCAAYERCECMGHGFASAAECEQQSIATFDRVAEVPGVTFDLECFEDLLERFETVGCGGWLEEEVVPCVVLAGTLELGDRCTLAWSIGDSAGGLTEGPCGGDLVCTFGTCSRPPIPGVGEGAPCHLELGVSCGGAGLYCSPEGICKPQAEPGEACDSPAGCMWGSTHYCAGLRVGEGGSGTCTEKVPSGGSCDPEDFAPCAPTSGLGDYCSDAGVCTPSWPAVCTLALPPPGAYWASDWIPYAADE